MGRLPDGPETAVENLKKRKREKGQRETNSRWPFSLSKNPELAAVARKQRFATRPAMRGGLRTAVALRAVLVLGATHP